MTIKASPLFGRIEPKNSFNDSNPPAEAPMPTTIKGDSELAMNDSRNSLWSDLTLCRHCGGRQPTLGRQMNFKDGSYAGLALNSNITAVIFDDALADRQSQTQAAAFLRGIKRLKNLVERRRFDATPRIPHRNHDFRRAGVLAEIGVDGQLPAVGHGIDGIEVEIDQHLRELLRVGVNPRQIARDFF